MAGFDFKIIKKIGVLSTAKSGWQCELNYVSWDGRNPVYDIRDWSLDHTKMSKGKSLSKEELQNLKEILNRYDIDNNDSAYNNIEIEDKSINIDFDK